MAKSSDIRKAVSDARDAHRRLASEAGKQPTARRDIWLGATSILNRAINDFCRTVNRTDDRFDLPVLGLMPLAESYPSPEAARDQTKEQRGEAQEASVPFGSESEAPPEALWDQWREWLDGEHARAWADPDYRDDIIAEANARFRSDMGDGHDGRCEAIIAEVGKAHLSQHTVAPSQPSQP